MEKAKNKKMSRFGLNVNALYFVVLGIALVILLIWLFWPQAVVSQNSFGQCLTDKGVVMYGSDQCSYCLDQKAMFGEDFVNVNYLNCDFNQLECKEKGISFYPVWSRDNEILVGVQSLQILSEFSGCEL